MTDLRGIWARMAAKADDDRLAALLAAVRAEPEPRDPHTEQAIAAFEAETAARREEAP